MRQDLHEELNELARCLATMVVSNTPEVLQETPDWIVSAVQLRSQMLAASVHKTVAECPDIMVIVKLFLHWMQQGTVVRVIGAGRARLAAAIPANRLAHGGANVFVQDDIIPMPHSVNGGAVLAASASGKTPSVLDILKAIRETSPHITVVGIAKADAKEFEQMCHHFIGIREDMEFFNPLSALADVGEYVISEVLDALVVAAGKLGGFDDRKWRMGHENIGPTGPYDARSKVDLLFTERW